MRSWLFVPGDSEKKIDKAATSAADALIFDLEDAVAGARKPHARQLVSEFLVHANRAATPELWVRINPFDSAEAQLDLDYIIPGKPNGLVVPKAVLGSSLDALDQKLADLEAKHACQHTTRLLLIGTETPSGVLSLTQGASIPARVSALTWGAEDLAAYLGAASKHNPDGSYRSIYETARSLCRIAAAHYNVACIDSIYPNFGDLVGTTAAAQRGCEDGFDGMLAIHPGQVDLINAAFTPSEHDLQWAKKVISAFSATPEAGVISLDGSMLDRPHLVQARKLLRRAK